MSGIPGHRVIVFLQENKTTDFYFPTLAAWGAAVANQRRRCWRRRRTSTSRTTATPGCTTRWATTRRWPVQIDNDAVIPFYSWLAKQFVFCDHHFGLGRNSTPGHMLAIGGQTPTMKNPPFVGPHPVWDLPSIFSVAEAAGVSWAAFPDQSRLPDQVLRLA